MKQLYESEVRSDLESGIQCAAAGYSTHDFSLLQHAGPEKAFRRRALGPRSASFMLHLRCLTFCDQFLKASLRFSGHSTCHLRLLVWASQPCRWHRARHEVLRFGLFIQRARQHCCQPLHLTADALDISFCFGRKQDAEPLGCHFTELAACLYSSPTTSWPYFKRLQFSLCAGTEASVCSVLSLSWLLDVLSAASCACTWCFPGLQSAASQTLQCNYVGYSLFGVVCFKRSYVETLDVCRTVLYMGHGHGSVACHKSLLYNMYCMYVITCYIRCIQRCITYVCIHVAYVVQTIVKSAHIHAYIFDTEF